MSATGASIKRSNQLGRWEDKYVIGLTGNIAMGKSLILRMLQHLGAYTIDADALAHRVMAPNAPAYKPIVQEFGQFILTPQKEIDRNKLATIVFADPDALAKLERITHPLIRGAIDMLIQRSNRKIVVVEAIKLIEGELADQVDAIWVVDSTPENQMRRLIAKRRMSPEDAKRRVMFQNPQQDKLARADVVITNNGSPEDAWKQVQAAWRKIAASTEAEEQTQKVQQVQVKQTEQEKQAARASGKMELESVNIKRPQPKEFDKIATLINQETGSELNRADIMMNFGEKTYMLAEANNQAVGVIAFLVENLVTRVDEFILSSNVPVGPVGEALIEAMEEASDELQSEVAFIFLPESASDEQKNLFIKHQYEQVKVDEIRIPAWRDAVSDSRPENTIILTRRLREKLVLKPI
jgi:dephospho-CoA kinase